MKLRSRFQFRMPKSLSGAVAVGAMVALSQGCADGLLIGGEDGGSRNGSNPGGDAKIDGLNDSTVGGDPPGVDGIGWTTRYPRLSHSQWENTVRDLLRLDAAPGLASTFSLDPDDAPFDTFAVRWVSSNLWSDYARAAEIVARSVARDSAQLSRLRPASAPDDAAAFVRELGSRAFRRPMSDEEVTTYVGLFNRGAELLNDNDAYASGAEMVIRTMLQSPHFLYRVERSTEVDGDRIWLDGYEVATRLSYALWNSMPSDELLAAAGDGELDTQEGVRTWARRMLDDSRAEAALMAFHEQFFHIKKYGTIYKNEELYPTFDLAVVQPLLQQEARLFFRDVTVQNDGGIADILQQPITYVNAVTAPFYGVSGDFGNDLQRVELDSSKRAGILTQLGFLSTYGSQAQSDPILRGVHISIDTLCKEVLPPPNDVPPLPPLGVGETNRQRVEVSTSVQPCAGCHETYINPLGFAFENYDAVGQWRDTDNGQPVDASSVYELDGEMVSFDNAVELSAHLASSDQLHMCYSMNWLEYALGRRPAIEEAGVILDLTGVSKGSSGIRDLLATLTSFDTFRARPQDQ